MILGVVRAGSGVGGGVRGRWLHRGGLLVHVVDELRQPRGHDRPHAQQHLRRHRARAASRCSSSCRSLGALARGRARRVPVPAHPGDRSRRSSRITGGVMTDNLLTIDQQLALRSAAARLAEQFDGVFGTETVERFLTSSYDQFADRATAVNFLPVMAERFARQRLKALARVEGKADDGLPTVLFLCVHNAGRSQMALGWFEHLAGDRAVAWSGGSEPGNEVNPVGDRRDGGDRHRHQRRVPQAVDRRDRPGGRRRRHDGLRRRLPVVPGQALRGLGARGSGRAGRRMRCDRSATRSVAASASCSAASTFRSAELRPSRSGSRHPARSRCAPACPGRPRPLPANASRGRRGSWCRRSSSVPTRDR